MDKMETTTLSKMAIGTKRRLQQWLRWLHGQDEDYNSGLDGYMDKMETTTVSKMQDGYMDTTETTSNSVS